MKNKQHLKYRRVGPGGWNCPCCGPCPKHRKFFTRLFKKQMYRELDKQENQLLD